jgi:hypothetical protein
LSAVTVIERRIIELREQGWGYRQIGEAVGMSHNGAWVAYLRATNPNKVRAMNAGRALDTKPHGTNRVACSGCGKPCWRSKFKTADGTSKPYPPGHPQLCQGCRRPRS